MRSVAVIRGLLLVLILAACVVPCPCAPTTITPPPCPVDKIAFTQDTGCLNDGSVEFCVPAHDPAALAAVRHIAPDVTCMHAGGRAHCDTTTEILCLLPTRKQCTAYHGALTDSRWQAVCDLAALPFVRQIVPTWYE
jgi:hypothetical protein